MYNDVRFYLYNYLQRLVFISMIYRQQRYDTRTNEPIKYRFKALFTRDQKYEINIKLMHLFLIKSKKVNFTFVK